MKLIITIIVSVISTVASAQDWLPPFPDLTDKSPKWTYLSIDSNFVKNDFDPFSSKYSHKRILGLQEVGENILLLQSTLTQSPYLGLDGFLLHSIDTESGDVNYVHHNNIYVGNFNREAYTFGDYWIDDNKLEISGIQHQDLIDTSATLPVFYPEGPVVRRVIDLDSGSSLSHNVGPTEEDYRLANTSGVGNIFLQNKAGARMRTQANLGYAGDSLYTYITVYNVNEDLSLDSTPIFRTGYYSGFDNFASFQLAYPLQHFQVGDDHFAALFGQKDLQNGSIPKRSTLRIFDMSDPNNISMTHEIEVLDEFYFPQSPGSFNAAMWPLDDYIMVRQQFSPLDLGSNVETAFWCNIYDTDGELKWRIPLGNYQEQYYYNFMAPLGSKGGDFYFAARRSYETLENSVDQYDIVKISTGNQTLERLGVIDWTLDRDEEFYRAPFGLITKDDDLLLHIRTTFPHPETDRETNAEWLALFDGMDVGLKPTSTSDHTNSSVEIYPNPTADYLQVNYEATDEFAYVLIDQQGRQIRASKLERATARIDLSDVPAGTYYLTVSSGDYAISKPVIVL